MTRSLSPLVPWLRLALSGLLVVACSNGEDEDADDGVVEVVVPPVLRFTGLTTTEGERYAASASSASIGCDRRFTVHLDAALIRGEEGSALWTLQPPARCGDEELACGYVRLTLVGADDETVFVREAAALDFVVDPGVEAAPVSRLSAELIQGNTREPYLVRGQAVNAAWELDLSFEEGCSEGAGGAGGAGGAPNAGLEGDDAS